MVDGLNPFHRDGVYLEKVHVDFLSDSMQPGASSIIEQVAQVSLLRVVLPNDPRNEGEDTVVPVMNFIRGPASSDTEGEIILTTDSNPSGLAPMEWSNALARVVQFEGRRVV